MQKRRKQDNDFVFDNGIKNSSTKLLTTTTESDKNVELEGDIRGDRGNIAILFFLYLLQGIPIGLTQAIPMFLQNRGASYKQQAEFSFAYWPFSLKLLWAPLVDSVYSAKFGRRKSWLIPTQYLIGFFMLILSLNIENWLNSEDGALPNVGLLTCIFFGLNFLAATQDIAVDGWALTMLKRCNVGHASTCNSVGQTAGYFLGYIVFIALESTDFCNSYLRSEPAQEGLVTLPDFLWFWGICFLITTTLVAIFKHEYKLNEHRTDDDSLMLLNTNKKNPIVQDPELNIYQSYKLLWKIINMKSIRILSLILLTVKLTFAASDSVTPLKLVESGIPKEKLALLSIPMIPLQIVLPLLISKYTTGPKPMEIYIKSIPYRLVFAIVGSLIVFMTPFIIEPGGIVPIYYYIGLLLNYAIYQIFVYCMFVAVMSFFAKISDPAVGGTYMTLLNTLCNLGGNWPAAALLWMVDILTWRECISSSSSTDIVEFNLHNNTCTDKFEQEACKTSGGVCQIIIDGYYIECIFCVIYGLLWYRFGTPYIRRLQKLPVSVWRISNTKFLRKNHDS